MNIRSTENGFAIFSPCETYRYVLGRTFETGRATVAFIGLNPSTATEAKDDPTMRRCIAFSQRWGYRHLIMLNLFAYRATDPHDLDITHNSVIGEDNDLWLRAIPPRVNLIIAAWGAGGKRFHRGAYVRRLLKAAGTELKCFDVTNGGHPKHPLYVHGDTEPRPYGG